MKKIKKINTMLLAAVLVIAGCFAAVPVNVDAATWNTSFARTSGTYTFSKKNYPGLQGLAFDTYTGKDGYCFATSKNNKKVALTHFTMNAKGKCKIKKSVIYKAANVGHANDATLFKDQSGNKWIMFTVYGTVSESLSCKDSSGKALKLGLISLNDFNKGVAKVYSCDISDVVGAKLIRSNITGVTYIGDTTIVTEEIVAASGDSETAAAEDSEQTTDEDAETAAAEDSEQTTDEDTETTADAEEDEDTGVTVIRTEKKAPEFVLMNGQIFVKAYLEKTGSGMKLVLNSIRARITKPTFKNGKLPKYQGVTYHSGYLYICGEGQAKDKLETTMIIAKIKLNSLFNGVDKYEKKMDTLQKNIKKQGKIKLGKNGPETVFFTNLNGKSRLYLSVNRTKKNGSNFDAIIRSAAKY